MEEQRAGKTNFRARLMLQVLLAISVLAALMFAQTGVSHSLELKQYKERLFKYRKPIETRDNGNFLRLPYDPRKDINQRDSMPVRKVKGKYVSSVPTRKQIDTQITAEGRTVSHFAVGALQGNAAMTVVFLHGRDGSRHLGFSDEKFGGNFNRVKNLMYRNGGIYLSADFTDFEEEGVRDIAALLAHYRPLTRGKMVIACGSMGSFLCWRLMKNTKTSSMIDGYVIMGGFPDPAFLATGKLSMPASSPPVYFAHGSIDSVYAWEDVYRFYQALRSEKPGYPVRMALFDGGKHGTPVRMIDWRVALNWIAAR
ncbi:MAG: alpha/beta hydrolase [Pseudomonadota bacterium]